MITDLDIIGQGFVTGLSVAHGSEIPVIDAIITKGLKPMILGKDVLTIERLWQVMYEGTTRFGRKGAAVRAISGVDIALWDAVGKMASIPVSRLLGGYADSVKVYASGGFYHGDDDLDHLLAEMQGYIHQGFRALKMKVGRDFRKDVKRVESVRSAVGNDVDILVDANEAWDCSTAFKFIDAIRDLDIYWLEEPLKPDDIDGYAMLNQKSPIPIAAGENEYTKWGFKDLIANRAVSIVQPDVTRVGGITEWMKVATMAQAWNMVCVPHAVQEIHISLVAAVTNSPMMEYFTPDHFLQNFLSQIFREPASFSSIKDGYIPAPQTPGLGLEIDWDMAGKYRVQ
jgi:D-arabinonate dehydratase